MTNATNLPLVSVVIPAYAAAACIQTALDSVLQQSFASYEIIVVNDGSPDTDLLESVLKPYLARIRYFKRPHMGPSAARNFGVLQARGEYVAFLDSDDFWMTAHLESAIKMFREDPGLGLVYSDSFLVKNGHVVGRTFAKESQVLPVKFDSLLAENCTITMSTTVASKRALLLAGLFDDRMYRCEDFDLWLRMAFRGVNMTHHSDATACRAVSSSGLSANRYRMKCDRLAVYAKIGSLFSLSEDQKRLLRERHRRTEADAQLDRFKSCLHDGDFQNAASAARLASRTLRGWKLRAAVSCLERAPHTLRLCYRAHESVLLLRNRVRSAKAANTLQVKLPAKQFPQAATGTSLMANGSAAGD